MKQQEVASMLNYAIRYRNIPQIDFVLVIFEDDEQILLREDVIYSCLYMIKGWLPKPGFSM